MQPHKMATILGENCALSTDSKVQYLFVWYALGSLAGLLSRQYVVSQCPQQNDDRKRKLLVGIQLGHKLCVLVIPDGNLDFVGKGLCISPGVLQVRCGQLGKGRENPSIVGSQASVVDQTPNWNTSTGNTGITADHTRNFCDTAPDIAETLSQKLNRLGFFFGRKGEQLGLKFLKAHGKGGKVSQTTILGLYKPVRRPTHSQSQSFFASRPRAKPR